MEKIIEKLVEKFGKDKVIEGFELIGLINSGSDARRDHDCETGYYWSETLQKCVLDIGGHP